MIPSVKVAERNFDIRIVPRRVRDQSIEEWHYHKYKTHKTFYRRSVEGEVVDEIDEVDGGLYEWCSFDLTQLSHFGLGAGLYYFHLLILFSITIIAAFIYIPIIITYSSVEYNNKNTSGYFKLPTAVCDLPVMIYRDGCAANSTSTSFCAPLKLR